MEESHHYSSRSESKRKYDDQGTPTSPAALVSSCKPTGFSTPTTSPNYEAASPTSFNIVPPPPDGIQLTKKRAQEIAAMLFSDAEETRPRVEKRDGDDDSKSKGFRFVTLVSSVLQRLMYSPTLAHKPRAIAGKPRSLKNPPG